MLQLQPLLWLSSSSQASPPSAETHPPAATQHFSWYSVLSQSCVRSMHRKSPTSGRHSLSAMDMAAHQGVEACGRPLGS